MQELSAIMMNIVCWIGCTMGVYHFRCIGLDDGLYCTDCGYFKSS